MAEPTISIKAWVPPTTLGQRVGTIRTINVSDNTELKAEEHIQFYNKNLGELQLSIDEAEKLRDFLNKTLGE